MNWRWAIVLGLVLGGCGSESVDSRPGMNQSDTGGSAVGSQTTTVPEAMGGAIGQATSAGRPTSEQDPVASTRPGNESMDRGGFRMPAAGGLPGGGQPSMAGEPTNAAMAGRQAMGGGEVPVPSPQDDTLQFACDNVMPYASEIISFEPGTNAGYGQSKLPDVVLGPPLEGPPTRGSLDVLSLGTGGEIVLGFGGYRVFNGPGPDFIVWENPFWIGGDAQNPFAELGEVAVSADGNLACVPV